MGITVSVVDRNLQVKFDAMPEAVKKALTSTTRALMQSLTARIRGRAAAHVKTGRYLNSIRGGVKVLPERIIGYVRSPSPVAHLLEGGAHTKAHSILPKRAQALYFDGRFARRVMNPGATIPPHPVIYPAFSAMRDPIRRALEEAGKAAARDA